MKSSGRRRMDAGERREAILCATVRLGLTAGLDRLTARQIAAGAGVTPGLVNHYFPNMDDLVAAAFGLAAAEERERTFADVDQQPTPLSKLRRLIELYFDEDDYEVNRLWIDAWSMAPRRPVLHAEVDRQMHAWADQLALLLTEGAAAGDLTTHDATAAAWRLLTLLDGVTVQMVLGTPVDYIAIQRLVLAAAECELALATGTLTTGG